MNLPESDKCHLNHGVGIGRLLAMPSPTDRVRAFGPRLAALARGLGAMGLGLGEGLVRLEQIGA